MSPVNRLARFPRSRLATLFSVKISLCSYERPGWAGYRDLADYSYKPGNRAGSVTRTNYLGNIGMSSRNSTKMVEHKTCIVLDRHSFVDSCNFANRANSDTP